jgi:hypothetical protein
MSISSKWIKELNVRHENLKLVQERAGNTLKLTSICNDLLIKTQKSQELRERIDKWDYMKLKCFWTQNKWSLNWRDCTQNGRNSFPAVHLTCDW